MVEKKRILLLMCCLVCLLTGCGKVIELTEEETQLIAEYSAELLLKYDLNYVDRIDEGENETEELSTEEESTTEAETTTEAPKTEQEDVEQSDVPDADTDEEEAVVGSEGNIAVIAGIENVDITFRDYVIVDKYPATDEQGEFIYLEASEGYQLLVLKFEVVNKSSDVVSVSLMDKELDYRIVCNGSKAAKPMLTILMDDLGTLETNVEPETPQEAVLVFQLAEGMKEQLETMDFYITYNETENKITILQ